MIEPDNQEITIGRQCELLCISRSGYYYEPKGENAYNHQIMRLIDEKYTRHPFYGSRRLTAWLKRQDHDVNVKRASRLIAKMGIEAVYQKPNLSRADKEHEKYPYLLGGLKVERPDQVWASDITYIRMRTGFVYLVVVMDWYSRYVLSHEISTSLESEFCTVALGKALEKSNPEIFNTDQGSQFTSKYFTGILKEKIVRISMDGKGRAFDNIFRTLDPWELTNGTDPGTGFLFNYFTCPSMYSVPAASGSSSIHLSLRCAAHFSAPSPALMSSIFSRRHRTSGIRSIPTSLPSSPGGCPPSFSTVLMRQRPMKARRIRI